MSKYCTRPRIEDPAVTELRSASVSSDTSIVQLNCVFCRHTVLRHRAEDCTNGVQIC
jgi:hypothetical protein